MNIDGKNVCLQIWDTAGQERFRTISKNYFTDSNGILLIYSITDQKSFANIRSWIKQIQINEAHDLCKILIANKCDCKDEDRKVTYEEGSKLAQDCGLEFFEVSAKNGNNIDNCFNCLTEKVIKKYGDALIRKKKRGIKLNETQNKANAEKKECCH